MRSGYLSRAFAALALVFLLLPSGHQASVHASDSLPPVGMFQLPWEQGSSWVALDGFDNGFKRLLNSPHFYLNGGAVDFAPHNNTRVGEDTSTFWVTAAAAGTVVEISNCHLKIDHGNGWITEYQFLANIRVKLGEAVYRNERLAVIADGLGEPFCPPALEPDIPHLHFSLRPTMRGATFSGWTINYIPYLNKTTFTKDGVTLTSYQPILNAPDLQISLRDPITWDTVYIGSVDAYGYERWPFVLDQSTSFKITASPSMAGLIPMLVLLDANGQEISRAVGTLKSSQPVGSYFVQVQPQSGNGFYKLTLQKDTTPVPSGPFVSATLTPDNIQVGQSTSLTIGLGNVPTGGYTSMELTCSYDTSMVAVGNIATTDLFGSDPAVAINGPQNGAFIVAIAGSNGNRATSNGNMLSFSLTGLRAGQTSVDCKVRTSKGDNILTALPSVASSLTILSNSPAPTQMVPAPRMPTTVTPIATATDWLTLTNVKYGFEFQYPPLGKIMDGGNDNDTRIELPFNPGTNLREKYLDMLVAENVNPCQSPLATQSMLETTETVAINGNPWLKQTGQDGTAGHLNKWVAYSRLQNNNCISFDFVLRSANPGVFTTPPVLYNEDEESAVFGQILSTFTQQVPASPTPTATLVPVTDGTVTGQVLASKPVTVSLYNAGGSLAASVTANADGTLSLTVPSGTYTAVASAIGFLNAQSLVTVNAGASTNLPVVSLPAGDIDGNKTIDQYDAMTIGMGYNTDIPTAADLNNDGVINILDLELLAANYRKSGALAWK